VIQTEWGGETAYLAAIRDITAQKRVEEEAGLRHLQLIQADKMASIGILASGIAHEINNPNGVIMLNAAILSKVWNDAQRILDEHYRVHGDFDIGEIRYSRFRDKAAFLFSQMIESSERIKRIVAEIKDYARQDVSDFTQDVQMNDVLKSAASLAHSILEKSTNHFEMRCAPNLPVIKGSFHRLEQVIINLLINACQALPDRSRSIFAVTSFDEHSGMVSVMVRDQGSGISEADLKHVFDPFFTTKRGTGGTGLGLYISRGIAEEHGGRLELTSVLGEGTAAILALPRG